MPITYTYRLRLEVIATYPSLFNKVVEVNKDISGTLSPENPGKNLREIVSGMLAEVKREQTEKKALGRRLARGMSRKARYYD